MNKNFTTLALLLLSLNSFAQVGIGGNTPNASTMLDVTSTNKGILIPRVALTDLTDGLTITNGNVNSLLVFNTTDNDEIKPGYYYWFENKWLKIQNEFDIVRNDNFSVIGADLVLEDSKGNTVSIPLEDINLPDVVTNLSYNTTTGVLTYTNEVDDEQSFNLSDVVKNFETLTVLEVDAERGVLIYTDEANIENELDLKELVRNHQKTYSLVNGDSTIANTTVSGTNTEFKVDIDTNSLAIALGKELSATDSSIEITNGQGATLIDSSVQVAALGITTAKLAADAVTNDKLADNAVATENIVNGTIITEDLADNSVTSAKILDGTIATIDLANNAVTSAKILDGTIITEDLSDEAVTTDKILDGTILNQDIANNAINSSKIENNSVNTIDIANNAITTDKILDGTINNVDIKDKTIAAVKLDGTGFNAGDVLTVNPDSTVTYQPAVVDAANVNNAFTLSSTTGDNSITVVDGVGTTLKNTTLSVTNSGITTQKIQDLAVTNVKIQNNAVTTDKILNGTIITEDLADNSISTSKIIDANVTLDKLAENSVNSSKIVDGSIVNQDIANKTILATKLSGQGYTTGQVATVQADGSVIYQNPTVSANNITNAKSLTAADGSIAVTNGAGTTIKDSSLSVADGGIVTAKLANNAVNTEKIANNAVNSAKIVDGSILNNDIANQTIQATKLDGGANNIGKVATVTNNSGVVEYRNPSIAANQVTNAASINTSGALRVNSVSTLANSVLTQANLTIDTATTELGVVKQSADNATRTVNIDNTGTLSVNAAPLAGQGLTTSNNALNVNATNGLNLTSDAVRLGGALVTPTAIGTSATNTLAIQNLPNVTSTEAYQYATVDNTSGVVKKVKAVKPEYFYAPSIALPITAPTQGNTLPQGMTYAGGVFTVDLYQIYKNQYTLVGDVQGTSRTAIKSAGATGLTNYDKTDLDYFITYFDNTVFNPQSIELSNDGILRYSIIATGVATEKTYMNIVFKVK